MKKQLKNWLFQNNIFNYTKICKQILLLVGFLLSFNSKSQIVNYVSNPSFESLSSTTASTLYDAVSYWQPIDTNGVAYFLVSTDPGLGNAPYCSYGFQYPRTGKVYILATFLCTGPACSPLNAVGYPRNRLKEFLKPNTAYCAKYYINNTNNNKIAIDSYGMYFGGSSLDTIIYSSTPLTYLTPQVQNNTGVITDTLNWVPITGTFTAIGTEKYLLLGNFKSTANTNTIQLNMPSSTMGADVYIDDVSIIELNLPAYAGPDLWCIPGDSVFIGRQPDIGIDEDCMWYKLPNTTTAIDTVAGLWVKPTTTTTYIVKQDICGMIKWDTVIVNQSATGINEVGVINYELYVYPNPAKEEIQIDLKSDKLFTKPQEIKLLDLLGREVKSILLLNKKQKINISELKSGCYYLQFKNENDFSLMKKIIKN